MNDRAKKIIQHGPLKGKPILYDVRQGEQCGVCEGPCRYGTCGDCGGHSEHNSGCPRIG